MFYLKSIFQTILFSKYTESILILFSQNCYKLSVIKKNINQLIKKFLKVYFALQYYLFDITSKYRSEIYMFLYVLDI